MYEACDRPHDGNVRMLQAGSCLLSRPLRALLMYMIMTLDDPTVRSLLMKIVLAARLRKQLFEVWFAKHDTVVDGVAPCIQGR